MDEFVILVDDRTEARRRLAEVEAFLAERLDLRLNPRRRHVAPLSTPCDFLGYVHRPGGPTRVRRRNVRRLRRRLQALDEGLDAGTTDRLSARSSLASWVGLAGHADAFRLSRAIFTERDPGNLGKRLLVAPRGASFVLSRGEPQLSVAAASGPSRSAASSQGKCQR